MRWRIHHLYSSSWSLQHYRSHHATVHSVVCSLWFWDRTIGLVKSYCSLDTQSETRAYSNHHEWKHPNKLSSCSEHIFLSIVYISFHNQSWWRDAHQKIHESAMLTLPHVSVATILMHRTYFDLNQVGSYDSSWSWYPRFRNIFCDIIQWIRRRREGNNAPTNGLV